MRNIDLCRSVVSEELLNLLSWNKFIEFSNISRKAI